MFERVDPELLAERAVHLDVHRRCRHHRGVEVVPVLVRDHAVDRRERPWHRGRDADPSRHPLPLRGDGVGEREARVEEEGAAPALAPSPRSSGRRTSRRRRRSRSCAPPTPSGRTAAGSPVRRRSRRRRARGRGRHGRAPSPSSRRPSAAVARSASTRRPNPCRRTSTPGRSSSTAAIRGSASAGLDVPGAGGRSGARRPPVQPAGARLEAHELVGDVDQPRTGTADPRGPARRRVPPRGRGAAPPCVRRRHRARPASRSMTAIGVVPSHTVLVA